MNKQYNYSKELFYKQMSINIKGQIKMLRYDCAAHLEDKDDEYFWGRLFKRFANGKKILYITHSRSERGFRTTGVGHCLNYKDYLDEHFIICIDSDYRRLLGEADIDIAHYIFQTYTYSFENHHCVPSGINAVIEQICGKPNHIIDFHELLRQYSLILYEPLIWHLYFQRNNPKIFTKLEFRQLLSMFNGHVKRRLRETVHEELSRISQSAQNITKRLHKKYPSVDLAPLKEEYRQIGLEPERTYLFVRGHNIFDSLCRLSRGICETLLEKEKSTLCNDTKEIEALYDETCSFKKSLDEEPPIFRLSGD